MRGPESIREKKEAPQADNAREQVQESEAVSRSEFDYTGLDAETRQFVEEKAMQIHGLLKRTAEHIIAIGLHLFAVKERLSHGEFLVWLRAEFGLSHASALRFMRVAARLGDKYVNLTYLPAHILYELASPSFPDQLVEQVHRGELDPSLSALRSAKAAYKQAQEAQAAEQAARQRVQEAEHEIEKLTGHLEELHQQIALMQEQPEPTIIEKPVVPPQMQADLERLRRLVGELTREREHLMTRVEELGAHNRAEFLERNEVARHQRVRQQWRSVSAAWERSTRELSGSWPTLLDSESFGQEEWATLHHIKDAASELAERCEKLKEARAMIVDSGLSGLS